MGIQWTRGFQWIRAFLTFAGAGAAIGTKSMLLAENRVRQSGRPNFVFFLADDLGWKDLGCLGSSFYEIPHIDRLRARGMKFSNAYAACPVCSSTRAGIPVLRFID